MTTAPKLIREQLLALADEFRVERESCGKGDFPDGYRAAMEQAEIKVHSLAAEPVGGEIGSSGYSLGYANNSTRHVEQPDSAEGDAASDHVRRLVGKLDAWRLCMSYNDSYFGEPVGLVKTTVEELTRAIPPIYPEPKMKNPFERVVIYTQDHPAGVPANDLIHKLRATVEGKGDEYVAEDTAAMDRIFGEQSKAEGGLWVSEHFMSDIARDGQASVFAAPNNSASVRLSTAPQPELSVERVINDCICGYGNCPVHPPQPARDGVQLRGGVYPSDAELDAREDAEDERVIFGVSQPTQQADGGAVEPAAFVTFVTDRPFRMDITEAGMELGVGKHPLYAAPPKSPGFGVDDALAAAVLSNYIRLSIERHDENTDRDTRIETMKAALLAAIGGEK